MSIHKLTAGSGYDYLTRQVAALDATEKGHTGLASYYTERGETPGVRLVGDDQQLAAIGAGGVLRDIKETYGALRLSELHRFTDPAEAAASLTLREGDPSGLEFYLDHGRIHVGDVATTTEDAFQRLGFRPSGWAGHDHDRPDPEPRRPTERPCPRASSQSHARSTRGVFGRREPGRRRRSDHHPHQRPPTTPHRHRLG